MKKTLILIMIITIMSSVFACAAQDNLSWLENLEKAQEESKDKNLPILAFFTGSDWCVWCKRLIDNVFSKDVFKEYVEKNMILVKFDYPRTKPQSDDQKMYNRKLLQKYGVRGFPTVLILDSNGKVLGSTGFQRMGPAEYVQHLKNFLK